MKGLLGQDVECQTAVFMVLRVSWVVARADCEVDKGP